MRLEDRSNTVGFVGLGQMGAPMAENILKRGHRLVAYDIEKPKVEHAVSLGAQAASSPADAARRASMLISIVDTTSQAEEVIVGPGGFIETAQPRDHGVAQGQGRLFNNRLRTGRGTKMMAQGITRRKQAVVEA